MHETDLQLDPNEASDLCPLLSPALLERRGWDRAFVTVLDETSAEDSLAVLGHEAGAELGSRWHAFRAHVEPNAGKGKTEDAEACARYDGWIYLLGSQFGKKAGPLSARRSWIARVREDDLEAALEGKRPPLELVRLRFSLHRAVNDALLASRIPLLERGPGTSEAYIDATIARGEKGGKRWAGRVRSSDQPLNVEGADFRANGSLLLGLRYPVSADGQPLLVEVENVAELFEEPEAEPRCGAVWTLEGVGSADQPAGVRALHTEGGDRFDVVVGDLDAAGKGATVLADHPHGGRAPSRHLRFSLPLVARGGPVAVEEVHDFGELRRVEGVALGPDGNAHYVVDEEGRVALRTLVFE